MRIKKSESKTAYELSNTYKIQQDLTTNLPIPLAPNNQSEAKIINTKEIKPPVNLISIINKSQIVKPIFETDNHYYIVKEIIINANDTVATNEHEFIDKTIHKSKLAARLFFDNKKKDIKRMSVIEKSENSLIKLELYLVRNSNLEQNKQYLLIDSAGKEHIENRKIESLLLSATGTNKSANKNSNHASIDTKNSFLDGDYKD